MPSNTPVPNVLPPCPRLECGHFHAPDVDCPPIGVWLVGRFCPACTSTYCRRHAPQEYGRALDGVRIGRPLGALTIVR